MPANDKNPGLTLIIVRHSQAEDPEVFARTGLPDCERPLTSQGVKRMKRAGEGLGRIVDRVDRIFSSPCSRAEHTARIVARTLGHASVETTQALAPGASPEAVTRWMNDAGAQGVVMLVGHEPDLSRLVSWLCADRMEPLVEMKKGAVCAVHFEAKPARGTGVILWLMNQGQLRKL